MKDRVKQVLITILETFKSNDIPQAVAYSMFPVPDIPSAKWSLLNRTLMFCEGTQDGRGMKQWNSVNRYVKKGSKAFFILVPLFKKKGEDEKEKESLVGFMARPVFTYEQTDGEEVDYVKIEVPDLPLIEKAEEWGISVKAIPGNFKYKGYYSSSRKEIALATKEECVFFHELSHCAHEKVKGSLKSGQDPFQEMVAELSAQALCKLVGRQATNTLGNSYVYIEGYSNKIGLSPIKACTRILQEVEKVLCLILESD